MPTLSGIYDSAPIQPVCQIEQNLRIYTRATWRYYQVLFIEPMPRSSPMVVDMVVQSAALTIAANGTIAKQVVNILQLDELEFLHLRWEPIDDVEGVLWGQASKGRFNTRSAQARVDLGTAQRDPYLATTTFFILGRDLDMNLEVRNPNPIALPQARFKFWGYRYKLEHLATKPNIYTSLPAEGM